MPKRQERRRGLVFALVLVVALVSVYMLAAGFAEAAPQTQELVQKLLSVGGLGAMMVTAFAALTRVSDVRH